MDVEVVCFSEVFVMVLVGYLLFGMVLVFFIFNFLRDLFFFDVSEVSVKY